VKEGFPDGIPPLIGDDAMEPELPPGMLAYREYLFDVGGKEARIALTLEDINGETKPAKDARKFGATAYGMMMLFDVPNAPHQPFFWLQRQEMVALNKERGDPITDDVRRIVVCHIIQFFGDIAPDHPKLAQDLRDNGLLEPTDSSDKSH
jgi:hypothetical protein